MLSNHNMNASCVKVAKDKDEQEAIHEDRVTTFCSEILKDGSESTSRNTKLA